MKKTAKEYLKKMASYCSKSERCEYDVRKKLENTELLISDIDDIILYLKNENYIDNNRYAVFFVNDKFKFNKWGKLKIKQHLYQKQIDSQTIEQALKEIDDKEYYNLLKTVLEKKKSSLKNEKDKYKLKDKLIRYGLSKGFEHDLVFELINTII